MNRATRWTRFTHRAIGVSVVFAAVAAAVLFAHERPEATTLRLATADLRSRAAEAALVARAWHEHRATGSFTRMQSQQLAHLVAQARREAQEAPVELAQPASAVTNAADALLLALRDLEALPAPADDGARPARLRSLSDGLHAIERELASRD